MAKTKNKILIVEDEAPQLMALKHKFSQDFKVLTAHDGLDGLNIALAEHPDIILLDIIMPRMDGLTMLAKLREDSWGQEAKVIILTNLSNVPRESTLSQDKTLDYLVKTDWTLEQVVQKVKRSLK
ncbi:MAG: response regulator [Parcubacteria group bacterium]|nr:MAG: response regulator [Parcubacteria group bacterium]